jgi:hypothetical protein
MLTYETGPYYSSQNSYIMKRFKQNDGRIVLILVAIKSIVPETSFHALTEWQLLGSSNSH